MKSMIDINIDDHFVTVVDKTLLETMIAADLTKLGAKNYLIELNFVPQETIHLLNKQHRNIDRPTDVLSFPQSNPGKPKLNFLGSIVISPEIVSEKNETIEDAVKHGVIHLLGFDHEADAKQWDEQAMIIGCKL